MNRSEAAQTQLSHGRLNALWGRGGRRASAFAATLLCALGAATAATAAPVAQPHGAFVRPSLTAAIAQNEAQTYDVIVESPGKVVGAGFLKAAPGAASRSHRATTRSTDETEDAPAVSGTDVSLLDQDARDRRRKGRSSEPLNA